MATELTTSKTIPAGTKVERTPEQKEKDNKILDGYNVAIDQLKLEILRLEKALELKLPEREYRTQIEEIKAKIEQFENLKKAIVERNK